MTDLVPMREITARQRHDDLTRALADWQAATGEWRGACRGYARLLLRGARRERDAQRAAFQRTVKMSALRKSAANMRLIASGFGAAADQSTDQREAIAWDMAMSAIEDAAAALENGADAIEGVFQTLEAAR